MDDEIEIQQDEDNATRDDEDTGDEKLDAKLKKLKADLKICQKEKSEYLDGWQRAKADFINARRDETKTIEERVQYAKMEVLREFLVLADFADMAQKHSASEELTQIVRQLSEIFKKQGVLPIICIGEKFNPGLHEALMQEDIASEDKDDIVTEEFQKGYMIHDKVLRPSKVKVGVYKT